MHRLKHLSKMLPLLVVLAVAGVVARAARSPLNADRVQEAGVEIPDLKPVVKRLDQEFDRRWQQAGIAPAQPADDLQILRRLSLALHGTNPSLEEIRQFEDDKRADRLEHWTRRMLADKRFADYFAERLARGFVGTEGGQFIVYRRGRFVEWLSEQLQKSIPFDSIVRQILSQQGLWTGEPATNFITAAIDNGRVDENKLAGKSVRAFLGQRIDCAQCHNHPFDHWKQSEFEGIAAFFGQVQQSIVGIEDKPFKDGKSVEYEVQDRKTLEHRKVAPAVPFHPEWLPESGTRRERFAHWVTHPENRRFERAVANRMWALLFGRPYLEPVDDLPDPPPADKRDVLDWLGQDFREHRYDLKQLVQVIVASPAFRVDSKYHSELDAATLKNAEANWAVFPLIRLRPEQVMGSILQSSTVQTADQNSHLLLRLARLTQGGAFVKEYGDLGEDELQERGGTIPQRLLMLNGELSADGINPKPFNASGRIAGFASTDEKCVEAAFLVCLTRRPTPAERDRFMARLKEHSGKQRGEAVEDMFWTLFNSTEFSWNH